MLKTQDDLQAGQDQGDNMTLETINRILYDLTYENGLTFGMCGNARDEQKQLLVERINKAERNEEALGASR